MTTTTNPSVRKLLILVLRHVSTEIRGAPSRCKYIYNRVLYRSRRMDDLDAVCQAQIILNLKRPCLCKAENQTYVHYF
jgi:hypothetical protein